MFFASLRLYTLLAALAVLGTSVRLPYQGTSAGHFFIQSGSQLYLQGSSNVTGFTCQCECYDPQDAHPVQWQIDNQGLRFTHTAFRFPTTSLNCGHRGINRDMYATLKADDYPHIQVALLQVNTPTQAIGRAATTLRAQVALTIAGVRKQLWLPVRAERLASGQYRLVSEVQLNMTDFGISPPTAMLGLVKVDNAIAIHFDLRIALAEV